MAKKVTTVAKKTKQGENMLQNEDRFANIKKEFNALANTAEDLNKASDSFAKAITELEKVLNSLNLGIEAWYTFGCIDKTDRIHQRRDIGYTKIGNTWMLAIRLTETDKYEGNQETTIQGFNQTARQLREDATLEIEHLISVLRGKATSRINSIKLCTNTVQELTNALRTSTKLMPNK